MNEIDFTSLPINASVEVCTTNSTYIITKTSELNCSIDSTNKKYCCEACRLEGSVYPDMKAGYIVEGMCLEFFIPNHGYILTTRIKSVRRITTNGPDSIPRSAKETVA